MRNILIMAAVLVLAFALAETIPATRAEAGRIGIAAVFCLTAIGHFAKPDEMMQMLPEVIPARRTLVLLSGLFEAGLAGGFLFQATARLTASVAVLFLIAVLPLNIYSALNRVKFGGHSAGPKYLLARVPLQGFLIGWIWWFCLRGN